MRQIWIVLLLCTGCTPAPQTQMPERAPGVPGAWSQEGFQKADRPRPFHFPEDHAPHQGYRTEWWYLTGNLHTQTQRRFGYQITLFRIALTPQEPERVTSLWRTSHIWMAHLALSDVQRGEHHHQERFAREAIGLAGAERDPLRLWLEDWQLLYNDTESTWRVSAATAGFALELELEPLRKPTLQGESGLSRKGSETGNASYYYSITRLTTRGDLRIGAENIQVTGLSWLDREWSTSALGKNLAGWDWFSLQLNDGSDLMFYRLREKSGVSSVYSAGSLARPDTQPVTLKHDDVECTPLRWWKSGKGARYPVAWTLYIKPLQLRLVVEALLDDQEMDLSVRYWEGAVRVHDEGQNELGAGYLEMTGY
ncbi:MAG: carotenoid 1,2-hydratase [Chromatiaceae bacterium]|nr:carotenoid 1,2-hydratase [Chromatiaceae bacterium]